ncbi:hypothetical protein SteCoe_13491 [Stentor coeruleus]|uniref:Uncharacterized protein n=1 Tax=Stentor coeruleus TaxID=5963 RepID=A0A1R2C8B7_9CILI|nr:hypothetical protein SteCoe_13491 [Stentor coeruleus]
MGSCQGIMKKGWNVRKNAKEKTSAGEMKSKNALVFVANGPEGRSGPVSFDQDHPLAGYVFPRTIVQ